MGRIVGPLAACVALAGFLLTGAMAQPIPSTGPRFADLEATWAALWETLARGDIKGARRYLHSSRQHLFPGRHTSQDLQDIARQMQFCRLVFNPLPLDVNEVMYPVQCRHGDETAEALAGFRKDFDGVWRLVTF